MSTKIQVQFGEAGPFDAEIGENLLQIALRNDVELDHACGGVCACSTCHVKVEEGADALNEASEDEEDQLDEARDVALTSRLGCQATIERAPAGGRIAVKIPAWNVNLVQEGH
jgi:2Fe-2S ferredoxin